jgi:hypothetical protein
MLWLFHRHGEYLSCEVRTCLDNAGFELLMAWPDGRQLEWYPSETEIEARWRALKRQLQYEGWGELYVSLVD